MQLPSRFAAALALLLAFAAPAFAEPLTQVQHDALAARIASFDAAMKASDMKTVLGVVPPKVLEQVAAQSNITTDQLIAAAQTQIDAAMANIKLLSFGMDLDTAQFATLPDGTQYALLPTNTMMDLGQNGKVRAESTTLALLDGDTWYLVRVEDPQQAAIFKQVYPAFADVEFPAGTMEPVKE